MPTIISRSEALKLGLKRYYPGIPCKNNHLEEKYTSSNVCRECERIKYKAFVSKQKELYYIINREKILARCSKWQKGPGKEKIKAISKKWEVLHPKARLRYVHEGPLKPKTELQWLKIHQAINRALKRILKNSSNQDLLLLQRLVQSLSCK